MKKILLLPVALALIAIIVHAQEIATCDQTKNPQGSFVSAGKECGGSGHCTVEGKDLNCVIDPATKEETKTLEQYGQQPEAKTGAEPPQFNHVPGIAVSPVDANFNYELPQNASPFISQTSNPNSFESIRAMQAFPGESFTRLPGGGPSIFETPAYVPYSGNLDVGRPSILQVQFQNLTPTGIGVDTAPFSPNGATGFVPSGDLANSGPSQTFFESTIAALQNGFGSLGEMGQKFIDTVLPSVADKANWFTAGEEPLQEVRVERPLSTELVAKIEQATRDLHDDEVPGTLREKMEKLRVLQAEYTNMISKTLFPADLNNPQDVEYLRGTGAEEASRKEAAELEESLKGMDPKSQDYKELQEEIRSLRAFADTASELKRGGNDLPLTERANLGGTTTELPAIEVTPEESPLKTAIDKAGEAASAATKAKSELDAAKESDTVAARILYGLGLRDDPSVAVTAAQEKYDAAAKTLEAARAEVQARTDEIIGPVRASTKEIRTMIDGINRDFGLTIGVPEGDVGRFAQKNLAPGQAPVYGPTDQGDLLAQNPGRFAQPALPSTFPAEVAGGNPGRFANGSLPTEVTAPELPANAGKFAQPNLPTAVPVEVAASEPAPVVIKTRPVLTTDEPVAPAAGTEKPAEPKSETLPKAETPPKSETPPKAETPPKSETPPKADTPPRGETPSVPRGAGTPSPNGGGFGSSGGNPLGLLAPLMQILAALMNEPADSTSQAQTPGVPQAPATVPASTTSPATTSPVRIADVPQPIPFTFNAPIVGIDSISGPISAVQLVATIYNQTDPGPQTKTVSSNTSVPPTTNIQTIETFLASLSRFLQSVSPSGAVSPDLSATPPVAQQAPTSFASLLQQAGRFLSGYLGLFSSHK